MKISKYKLGLTAVSAIAIALVGLNTSITANHFQQDQQGQTGQVAQGTQQKGGQQKGGQQKGGQFK